MADKVIFPVHAISSYLWTKIREQDILDTVPYNGINLRPIVPVEEVPQLMEAIDALPGVGSYPFLVYNWTYINAGQLWFVKTHEVAYSIRSDNDEKMNQLIAIFDKNFLDYDEAAKRVNAYIDSLPSTSSFKKFNFKYINLSVLGGPAPADTENGINEAIVTLRVAYTEL